jgi:hypothetical protein
MRVSPERRVAGVAVAWGTVPSQSPKPGLGRPRTRVNVSVTERHALRAMVRGAWAADLQQEPRATDLMMWVADRLAVSEAKVRRALYGSAPVDATFLGQVIGITTKGSQ